MSFDPETSDLGSLFRDRDMFDSAHDWSDAGFKIIRSSENKICVASHRDAPGYLFKKYVSSGKRDSLKDQLENYETRVEGAKKLRSLIDDEHLQHVVVPRKWIRELPSRFSGKKNSSHIMVVQRLDLIDDSEREYRRISPDVLADLCVVLRSFRGLDSRANNMPFTTDGKVAFIDTEHWNRHAGKSHKQRKFLKYVGEHMSGDRRKLAQRLFDGGGRGDYDDFEDEEDTSSSSSDSSDSS